LIIVKLSSLRLFGEAYGEPKVFGAVCLLTKIKKKEIAAF